MPFRKFACMLPGSCHCCVTKLKCHKYPSCTFTMYTGSLYLAVEFLVMFLLMILQCPKPVRAIMNAERFGSYLHKALLVRAL